MTAYQEHTHAPAVASDLRAAFRRRIDTVSVITVGGIRPVGFTATSLTSVSLAPPVVSFSLSRTSSSWPSLSRTHHLAAHVLTDDQLDVAQAFATSGIDRFATAGEWTVDDQGVPLLAGALIRLSLTVHDIHDVGDSAVVLADVVRVEHSDGAPLTYHDGAYNVPAYAQLAGLDPLRPTSR